MPKIFRTTLARSLVLALGVSVTIGSIISGFLLWAWLQVPSKEQIQGCLATKLNKIEICPGSAGYVTYKNIPKHFFDALIVSEDSTFWTHKGFDFYELRQSLQTNLAKKRYARGGSTLSQQLAKNLFLTGEKTLIRKFIEALITIKIESTLTKEQILERYANVVQLGKSAFGIAQASRYYFGKPPYELQPEESAFLVMLLPNPAVYSGSYYQKSLTSYANQRVQTILLRMNKARKLSDTDYAMAKFRARFLFDPLGADELLDEEMDLEGFWPSDGEPEDTSF